MTPRLFCGLDSLAQDQGGVARLSRLVARVLADPVAGLPQAAGVVLRDAKPPPDLSLPVTAAGGSQARFAVRVAQASLRHTHFVYGFLGLARAHGWLPGLRRPYLAFVCGVEAWPGPWGRPDRVAVARRATRLAAISGYTVRRATELDPTFARAEVCWLGTEEDELPPRPTAPPPRRVLIVGRMDEGYKGHAELIACWPQVVAAVPDAVLTIAGRGPAADQFRHQAATSPVASRIEFPGFVPEADMPALWGQTAVFAMPSRGEGFGLVYIEAMRHGVPVIASIHDAGAEVNADGESGYNVNMDRPDELPSRLIELLRNPERAAELGEGGRRRWSAHFRYSAFRTRFATILHRFLQD